jgi:hypothetical protein
MRYIRGTKYASKRYNHGITTLVVVQEFIMADQKIIKTSLNLPEQSIETLKDLANRTGSSMAEVVRRAVATEKFLRDTTGEGSKILIKDKDNSIRELVLR